jgi:hypothetical protein
MPSTVLPTEPTRPSPPPGLPATATTVPIPAEDTPTATPSPTLAPPATPTRPLVGVSTLLPSPTPAVLRAQVLVDTSCHYGPGVQYLYKYALIAGSNLEVIGQDYTGEQLLVRAIGGNNPCWVKADRMAVAGDLRSVATTYIPLPQSPYYGPLTGVSAERTRDGVTLSWNPLVLRAGDDSGQYAYLVEAWVCRAERLVFAAVGTFQAMLSLPDEPGCAEPSHGRVAAAEKHGYTAWVEIPWPLPLKLMTPPPE